MKLNDFLTQSFSKEQIEKSIYYAGIGSRETPLHIQKLMKYIASELEKKGFVLRSGGAVGADKAFESGIKNAKNKQIFYANDSNDLTREIACHFHPSPYALKQLSFKEKQLNPKPLHSYAHNLMARNTYQVMGENLKTPSQFVICWTPDGCTSHKKRTRETGGTGQAISIADHFNIPVYNLANETKTKELFNLLNLKEFKGM